MLILAIDTSGKEGSVALARGDGEAFELIETVPVSGGTFSAQLIPVISALLARHTINKKNIDAFAAASGPGSFTGLRIGLAAVKALAEILQKPIAAVSILEACTAIVCVAQKPALSGAEGSPAVQTLCDEIILVLLDALRSEVFAGEFEAQDNCHHCLREWLMTRAELVDYLQSGVKTTCTPDENVLEFLGHQNLEVIRIPRPTSIDIARLGIKKILAGQIVGPETLDANYIRRSGAEIINQRNAATRR